MAPVPRLAAILLCLCAVSARAQDCAAVRPDAADYALAELPCLRAGAAAGDAAALFQALSSAQWPPGLTRRLGEAGLRVRFAAPDARAEAEQSGVYAWRTKTVHLWDRPRAAVVVHELGHALDDLLQPDDLAGPDCRVMTSNADPEFVAVWKAYLRRVNAHMGVTVDDDGGRLLPVSMDSARTFLSSYSGSASGWFTELPLFDDPKNPVTGPRGYVSVQEYWAETVQRYFTSRDWLKAKDPAAFAFVAGKLRLAESGALETVTLPLDASRCDNAR